MSWSLKVESSFRISGKGVVVTGRHAEQPAIGKARLTTPDGVEQGVEVIGVERFVKLMPIPSDNVTLLLSGLPHSVDRIPVGSTVTSVED